MPLSLSLPLRTEPASDILTRAYFDNLLPESAQLDDVMARHGVARNDLIGLFTHLGADCPGAVSILPPDTGPVKTPGDLSTDYEPLDAAQLADLVGRLARREPIDPIARDPSPLAGVQRKLAVAYDARTETFMLPKPDRKVPTTHIIKVPPPALTADVRYEATAMNVARACGLSAARVEACIAGDMPYLLIERFDRHVTEDGNVFRLHQEDFAQALGLSARLKYERDGAEGRQFNARSVASILAKTKTPAKAREAFLLLTLFNLSVGNTDIHAKNHALLYIDGPSPVLAPAYDVLPVMTNRNVGHHLAFTIGQARHIANIETADIDIVLDTFGLKGAAATRFKSDKYVPLLSKIAQRIRGLPVYEFKVFRDLAGECIGHLAEILGIPHPLDDFDAFPPFYAQADALKE